MPGAGAGGAPNPMAALGMLAQRGQGGATDPQMSMLLFLAGMGAKDFSRFIEVLRGKDKGKPGLAGDAAHAPTQSIPPQLAQLMATRMAGQATQGLPAGAMPGMAMGAMK